MIEVGLLDQLVLVEMKVVIEGFLLSSKIVQVEINTVVQIGVMKNTVRIIAEQIAIKI